MSDNIEKLHVHKESDLKDKHVPKYPGPINESEDFEKLLVEEPFLKHPLFEEDNFHFKTSCKEDEDFIILNEEAWHYLYERYGGNDCPRYSIEVKTEEETEKQYMIEVFYKKLQIYILPKTANHLSLRKPSGVFVPRKSTIKDYKRKIAEILFENKKEGKTVEELMDMARLWRLDTGENVMEIEKCYDYESRESLPLQLRGRVLDESEVVDDINVADNDVLLYEVQ